MPPAKTLEGNAHPQMTNCSLCHGALNPATHIDGQVTYREGINTCYGCHGTQGSAGAPPPDVSGRVDIDEVTIGLHQVHLSPSAFADAVRCERCHALPDHWQDEAHIDASPAEVIFDSFVQGETRNRVLPSQWDRATATCTNVYCHTPSGQLSNGTNLSGGIVDEWEWNEPLVTGLKCTSCHAMPPPAPHPTEENCASCHGTFDPLKHVNGLVELIP
jgi:predicted CxxxxCH...CXXCH cytochrome family protein